MNGLELRREYHLGIFQSFRIYPTPISDCEMMTCWVMLSHISHVISYHVFGSWYRKLGVLKSFNFGVTSRTDTNIFLQQRAHRVGNHRLRLLLVCQIPCKVTVSVPHLLSSSCKEQWLRSMTKSSTKAFICDDSRVGSWYVRQRDPTSASDRCRHAAPP